MHISSQNIEPFFKILGRLTLDKVPTFYIWRQFSFLLVQGFADRSDHLNILLELAFVCSKVGLFYFSFFW